MKLTVRQGGHGYDVVLKRGVLERAGRLAALGGRVLVVTDDGVPEAYVKTLCTQCGDAVRLVLPAGEAHKDPGSCARILGALDEHAFGRSDVVAALGGGAVCALAGAAAGAWLGGLPLVLLPTTVTAQADAAVGGEHTLNLGAGRDLLRYRYSPAAVLADPATLDSLSARQVAAGLMVSLKMALVGSSELLGLLEAWRPGDDLERIIFLSLLYKKGLVEHDEAGLGQRQLLCFGHTVGNAIATADSAGTLLYGESLALGMLPMLESRTLEKRVKTLLARLGLPTACPCPAGTVLAHMRRGEALYDGAYTAARVKTAGQGYLDRVSEGEMALLLGAG